MVGQILWMTHSAHRRNEEVNILPVLTSTSLMEFSMSSKSSLSSSSSSLKVKT